jgi:competence protein ComEA
MPLAALLPLGVAGPTPPDAPVVPDLHRRRRRRAGQRGTSRPADRKESPVRYLLIVLLVVLSTALVPAAPALASAQDKPADAKTAAAPPVLNLNTAPAEQLERLPGVGPKTAARIIEYRQKNGGFKKIEELMNVRGIGEKAFLKMKNQLTVTAPKAASQ